MEKDRITFKKEVLLKEGETYSVCLRGARRYETQDEYDLRLECGQQGMVFADIVSQNHFRFLDISDSECCDNYDETARTMDGLISAMHNVYADFNQKEIVTILRFKIL